MQLSLHYEHLKNYRQPFLSTSETQLSDLVKLYTNMKTEFSKVTNFFSEDPKSQVDEFFGAFATFMADFEVRENNKLYN